MSENNNSFKKHHIDVTLAAFEKVKDSQDKIGVQIGEIVQAPGRLARKGVSILVTLIRNGRDMLVPFRVEPDFKIARQSQQNPRRVSWKGRRIHSIEFNSHEGMEQLVKKIIARIRKAWGDFLGILKKNEIKQQRSLLRGCKELFRRPEVTFTGH